MKNQNQLLIPAADVAKMLHYKSVDSLMRVHKKLHEENGFPDPVPGFGKVMWSRYSIEAWLAGLVPENQRIAYGQIKGGAANLEPPNGAASPENSQQWSDLLLDRLKGANHV